MINQWTYIIVRNAVIWQNALPCVNVTKLSKALQQSDNVLVNSSHDETTLEKKLTIETRQCTTHLVLSLTSLLVAYAGKNNALLTTAARYYYYYYVYGRPCIVIT